MSDAETVVNAGTGDPLSPGRDPAEVYASFLSGIYPPVACEDTEEFGGCSEQPGELELQSRWYAGEFGSDFISVGGKPVEVRDFGHWNHSAGPDFTDCAVLVDGKLLRGSIELDPDVRDWERHGHGRNSDYDEVVLHLFVSAPAKATFFTRTSSHREVEQVKLELSALSSTTGRRFAEARPGRCANPLRDMPSAKVESLLEAAAKFRMLQKGERLARTAAIHGMDQVVFQGIAEALGYRRNRRPMLVLAQRFGLRELNSRGASPEALLFGAAGFLEAGIFERAETGEKEYLRELWESWWKLRGEVELVSLEWNYAGIRPGNHPHRRLGALVALLGKWRQFSQLVSGEVLEVRRVMEFLTGLEHPFWNNHYTLTSGPAARPVALIGASRATEILVNLLIPMLVREQPILWGQFREMAARLSNEKVRRAAARLFGEGGERPELLRKVYQHQGLLQIYADFCLEDSSGCEECPFPEQLKDW